MPDPAPDLTEFEQLGRRSQRQPCQIAAALGQLDDPEEKAALEAALAKPKVEITTGAIEKWLTRRDLAASYAAITNHRQSRCACHA